MDKEVAEKDTEKGTSESAKPSIRVLIRNLNNDTKFDDLKKMLTLPADQSDLRMCIDRYGVSKNSAIATVCSKDVDALLEKNGKPLDGNELNISLADKRKPQNQRRRRQPRYPPQYGPRRGPPQPRWGGPGPRRQGPPRGMFIINPLRTQAIMNHPVPFRYNLMDVGVNLTHKKYKFDLEFVIKRAKSAGVNKMIATGSNVHHSQEALTLSRIYKELYCTAGVHPHDAKQWNDETIKKIEEIATKAECVAIGECGLDYNRNFSTKEQQLLAFEKQVELACKIHKPLFIHERDAHEDCLEILKKFKKNLPPVLIHCFTGKATEAKVYVDLGFYIGITGYIFKEKSEDGVVEGLKSGMIPPQKILLETDAPYMFPKIPEELVKSQVITKESGEIWQAFCGFARNEPCSLPVTLEAVANYYNMKPDDLAEITLKNSTKFFNVQ